MGTSIHALDLPLSDYRGLENCSEILNLTRPDAIETIHREFFEVGCDAVETNTFGGMPHVLAEFDLQRECYDINVAAAQIARRAADAYSTPAQPRYVIGSLGPGTKLISLRQIDYDTLLASYAEQIRGLLDGGVDALLIETCQDILQSKVAIQAARANFERLGRRVPLMVQVTMETTGTMLVGTDIAAALAAIETYPEVDVIGMNCATGPQEMSEHIRHLAKYSSRPISVLPNAGLPQLVNGQTHFPLSPPELARWLKEFVVADGVRIIGGCCGTTPAHLKAVVEAVRSSELPVASSKLRGASGESPTSFEQTHSTADSVRGSSTRYSQLATRNSLPGSASCYIEPSASSLYQAVPYRQDNSFLIVGERCNTNGSKKFRDLILAGDLDGCVQIALEQVKEEGAHVLDVCVDYVGRDGVPDMHKVVERLSREVTAPLMLDSTQPDVIEAGLKLAGGKCIINSVNLEDGEEKLARIARLCRQYGAAVVALTIDEDPVEAMAKTADRKLSIALRLHDLLVNRHGMREDDIFFDCLTFPITTGNEADRRLALETLDGIERVMRALPRCQSILGLSNVSFGLKPLARVMLNSVFLHEARLRGLTAAIVHAGKILPRTQISDERWNAALDLIYDRREGSVGTWEREKVRTCEGAKTAPADSAGEGSMGLRPVRPEQPQSPADGEVSGATDPLTHFIGLFGDDDKLESKVRIADLPIEERLRRRIIDGQRPGLEQDLDAALLQYTPLEIINTHLLDGMKTVGELFGSGQMQLPFVLKSAEAMKAAVAYLEPFMEKKEGSSRGKIVLATVRGDVHDIGKNLVDIILSNNGFTVYNLGIKQPISNVIAALHEHRADAIGLSGLLVKSTLVMRDDLHVLNEQEIGVPVILGGAALTRTYVERDLRAIYKGALFYARDAFDGLHLMSDIVEGRAPQTTLAAATVVDDSTDRAGSMGPETVGTWEGGKVGTEATPATGIAPPTEKSAAPGPEQTGLAARHAAQRNVAQLAAELEQRYGLQEIPDEDAAGAEELSPASSPETSPTSLRRSVASSLSSGSAAPPLANPNSASLSYDHPVPTPPFWGARVVDKIALRAALGYLNEVMLFQVQWGFRKRGRSKDEFKRYIDREVRPIYRELVARCERDEILQPQAVYGYWPCHSDGNDLIIYAPDAALPSVLTGSAGVTAPEPTSSPSSLRRSVSSSLSSGAVAAPLRELVRFTFPRQRSAPHRCLSDFWRPVGSGVVDVVAFHIVTAGRRVSEVAREWFAANDYQQYLFLHGLGVETAEALAEYMHKQVRMELGVAGHDEREISRLFQQGYQGSRYSFGYPACPALEDQTKLMQLLQPERIGIMLSEEYQLEPEQSTSAIIAYHPAARYFNVR